MKVTLILVLLGAVMTVGLAASQNLGEGKSPKFTGVSGFNLWTGLKRGDRETMSPGLSYVPICLYFLYKPLQR